MHKTNKMKIANLYLCIRMQTIGMHKTHKLKIEIANYALNANIDANSLLNAVSVTNKCKK